MERNRTRSAQLRPPDRSLSFLGAAGNVTGSRFLVTWDGQRVLIDCGMYQERKFASRNWDPFPIPPDSIDAVVLTHAHLDHSGYLTKLVREGFRGRIYCTAATADIATIILADSARIQEEDAAYKKRRHEREGRRGPHPEIPLYTSEDAEAVTDHFSPVAYGESFKVGHEMTAELHDAGHILGAATVQLDLGKRDRRRLVFSGDLGQWDKPLMDDPETYKQADYVVVESTYGDRLHENGSHIEDRLAEVITETTKRGGNIVIPSFAVERAQEVLYYLKRLMASRRIPRLMTFVDSPMATRVTHVFGRHPEILDEKLTNVIHAGDSPFEFPGLKFVRTVEESKAINAIRGSVIIIIAGAGMCNGGRIKHHLVNNISDPRSTVLFVGYQAEGTLGRHILDGGNPVRILGEPCKVNAKIVDMQIFSAHADRDGLMRWLQALELPPRQVFAVHGEDSASQSFAEYVRAKTGWKTTCPEYGESFPIK
jgi:metallo-beta-lactamase family protein